MSTIRECSAGGGGGGGGGGAGGEQGLGSELKVQFSCAKRFECCYKFRREQISQQNQQEEEVVITRSSWRGRADTYIPTEKQQTNLTVKSEEKL
jgi:hypothetical protein